MQAAEPLGVGSWNLKNDLATCTPSRRYSRSFRGQTPYNMVIILLNFNLRQRTRTAYRGWCCTTVRIRSGMKMVSPYSDTEPAAGVAVPQQRLDEAGEDGGVRLPTSSETTGQNEDHHPQDRTPEHTAAEPVASRPNKGAPVEHPPIAVFSQPIHGTSGLLSRWRKTRKLQGTRANRELREGMYMMA
jgi:hypothetical protein